MARLNPSEPSENDQAKDGDAEAGLLNFASRRTKSPAASYNPIPPTSKLKYFSKSFWAGGAKEPDAAGPKPNQEEQEALDNVEVEVEDAGNEGEAMEPGFNDNEEEEQSSDQPEDRFPPKRVQKAWSHEVPSASRPFTRSTNRGYALQRADAFDFHPDPSDNEAPAKRDTRSGQQPSQQKPPLGKPKAKQPIDLREPKSNVVKKVAGRQTRSSGKTAVSGTALKAGGKSSRKKANQNPSSKARVEIPPPASDTLPSESHTLERDTEQHTADEAEAQTQRSPSLFLHPNRPVPRRSDQRNFRQIANPSPHQDAAPNTNPADGGGVSEILLDPSPKKLPTSLIRLAASKKPSSKRPSAAQLSSKRASEDCGADRERPAPEEHPPATVEEESDEDVIYHVSALRRMWETSQTVGQSRDKHMGAFTQVRTHKKPLIDIGQRSRKLLWDLIRIYQKESPETDEDYDAIQASITALKSLVREAVDGDLSVDTKDQHSLDLLADLLFIILPQFNKTIFYAARNYTLELDISDSVIKELLTLTEMLETLSEGCLKLNSVKDLESGVTDPVRNYRFSYPTRTNLPLWRDFRSTLQAELRSREKARDLVRRREVYQVQKGLRLKQRESQEKRDKVRIRKETEQIRLAQLKQIQRQIDLPTTGPLVRAELEKLLPDKRKRKPEPTPNTTKRRRIFKQVGNSRSREVVHVSDSEPESLEPFNRPSDIEGDNNGESSIERISVFGANNNRQRPTETLNRWQMLEFIEELKRNPGPNRYKSISDLLGRSMDDVFALAKDLQEVMDFQHEQGKLTGEGWEWTRDIWVNPDERS